MNRSYVDIIIPIYGAGEHLRKCLKTLFLSTKVPFDLWLIDDRSPGHEIADIFSQISGWGDRRIHLLKNQENIGFGPSNNKAADCGKAPYILFLNSDTEAHRSFLELMLLNFLSPDVGAVGAKLIFTDNPDYGSPGTVQHCGVARNGNGSPYHIFHGKAAEDLIVNVRREINCVTGACLLTPRELFQEVGGFNPIFRIGAFEDVDYCWSIREKGYKVIYEPLAVLGHYFAGSGFKKTHALSGKNKVILLEKWGNLGSDEHLFR